MTRVLPALVFVLVAGCKGSCDELCGKLERCGLNPDVERLECEAACSRALDLAKDDTDPEVGRTFDAQRRCVNTSTCEEIAEGACYDEDLFAF